MSSTQDPVWVAEVDADGDGDLTPPACSPEGVRYRAAHILVRRGRYPVWFVDVELDGRPIPASRFDDAPPVERDEEPDLASGLVSVVVCTKDRAESLARCLASLSALDDPQAEFLVVDNASRGSATADVVAAAAAADPRIRYLREDVPGASRAKNLGLRSAHGEFVAFTDDDVIADRFWLVGLREGFGRAPDVWAVTGLVPPRELDTVAQRYFDGRITWSKNFRPRTYRYPTDEPDMPRGFPFTAGQFGTGANFAARRDVLERLGGFDERLGPGTPTHGGEDLDMFARVLLAGGTLVYEPSAIVWHVHRRDTEGLRAQSYGYGVGLGAYLMKLLLSRRSRARLLRSASASARQRGDLRAGSSPADVSWRVRMAERTGLAVGPFIYLWSVVRPRTPRTHPRA